jgi:hypothetical protein
VTFLLRSACGGLLGLARRLQDEGHEVELVTTDPEAHLVGKGLVDRSTRHTASAGEIIVNASPTRFAGNARVIGASLRPPTLEPPDYWKTFVQAGEASAFLARQAGVVRWRLLGDHGELCGLPAMLRRYLATQAGRRGTWLLCPDLDGLEVIIGGWFSGDRWVLPFYGRLAEHHWLAMPDDTEPTPAGGLGPCTPGERSVLWTFGDDEPVLTTETLDLLTDRLTANGYVGPVEATAYVARDGTVRAGRATVGFQGDALPAFLSLWDEGTVGDQLRDLVEGELRTIACDREALALTLRVSVPPYPTPAPGVAARRAGWPLDPMLQGNPARFYLSDAMRGDGGPALAGRDGFAAVLTAVGPDLAELRLELLEIASYLEIPEKQYRADTPIGYAEDLWRRLRGLGLLVGPPDPPHVTRPGDEGEDAPNDGGTPEAADDGGRPDPYSEFT